MGTELKIRALTETKNNIIKNKNSKKDNKLPKLECNNVLYSKKGKVYILNDGKINVVL